MAREGYHFIRGEGHWMKILGRPVDNYDRDGKEWTFELKPDKEGKELLEELGVGDRINKGPDKDRILFRHRLERADGTHNTPLTVVGPDDKPWDHSTLIGNGSKIEVKFKFKDNGKGRKDSLFPQAIRVGELVNYERQEFPPVDPDDEFFKRPAQQEDTFHRDFGLREGEEMDDDIPM